MTYPLDLTGAWAKARRASVHIETLRSEIAKAGFSYNEIPIVTRFEADEGAIVMRIDPSVEIGDDWSLIIGDAIHNLRSALDHLAWQLAIRKLRGKEPTGAQAANVQFPIVSDRKTWATHRHQKYMTSIDRRTVKKLQPLNFDAKRRAQGELPLLEVLAMLSNTDKHRKLHVAVVFPKEMFVTSSSSLTVGYEIVRTDDGTPYIDTFFPKPSQPGDIIAKLHVIKDAADSEPEVNLPTRVTGHIAINQFWDVVDTLDSLLLGVREILSWFHKEARRKDGAG